MSATVSKPAGDAPKPKAAAADPTKDVKTAAPAKDVKTAAPAKDVKTAAPAKDVKTAAPLKGSAAAAAAGAGDDDGVVPLDVLPNHHKGLVTWLRGVNGKDVVLYNQRDDPRRKTLGDGLNDGWCMALTACWIARRAAGVDFWDWFDPPAAACPVRPKGHGGSTGAAFDALKKITIMDVANVEAMTKKAATVNSPRARADLIEMLNWWVGHAQFETLSGGKVKRDTKEDFHIPEDEMPDDVGKLSSLLVKVRGWKMLNFSYTYKGKTVAHCVGIHVSHTPDINYFDPNRGELLIPLASFPRFFNGVWTKDYPKISFFGATMLHKK